MSSIAARVYFEWFRRQCSVPEIVRLACRADKLYSRLGRGQDDGGRAARPGTNDLHVPTFARKPRPAVKQRHRLFVKYAALIVALVAGVLIASGALSLYFG